MSQYDEDVKLAAQSGEGFDSMNAREIGDLHGEDPKSVLREIKALRKAMKKQCE